MIILLLAFQALALTCDEQQIINGKAFTGCKDVPKDEFFKCFHDQGGLTDPEMKPLCDPPLPPPSHPTLPATSECPRYESEAMSACDPSQINPDQMKLEKPDGIAETSAQYTDVMLADSRRLSDIRRACMKAQAACPTKCDCDYSKEAKAFDRASSDRLAKAQQGTQSRDLASTSPGLGNQNNPTSSPPANTQPASLSPLSGLARPSVIPTSPQTYQQAIAAKEAWDNHVPVGAPATGPNSFKEYQKAAIAEYQAKQAKADIIPNNSGGFAIGGNRPQPSIPTTNSLIASNKPTGTLGIRESSSGYQSPQARPEERLNDDPVVIDSKPSLSTGFDLKPYLPGWVARGLDAVKKAAHAVNKKIAAQCMKLGFDYPFADDDDAKITNRQGPNVDHWYLGLLGAATVFMGYLAFRKEREDYE